MPFDPSDLINSLHNAVAVLNDMAIKINLPNAQFPQSHLAGPATGFIDANEYHHDTVHASSFAAVKATTKLAMAPQVNTTTNFNGLADFLSNPLTTNSLTSSTNNMANAAGLNSIGMNPGSEIATTFSQGDKPSYATGDLPGHCYLHGRSKMYFGPTIFIGQDSGDDSNTSVVKSGEEIIPIAGDKPGYPNLYAQDDGCVPKIGCDDPNAKWLTMTFQSKETYGNRLSQTSNSVEFTDLTAQKWVGPRTGDSCDNPDVGSSLAPCETHPAIGFTRDVRVAHVSFYKLMPNQQKLLLWDSTYGGKPGGNKSLIGTAPALYYKDWPDAYLLTNGTGKQIPMKPICKPNVINDQQPMFEMHVTEISEPDNGQTPIDEFYTFTPNRLPDVCAPMSCAATGGNGSFNFVAPNPPWTNCMQGSAEYAIGRRYLPDQGSFIYDKDFTGELAFEGEAGMQALPKLTLANGTVPTSAAEAAAAGGEGSTTGATSTIQSLLDAQKAQAEKSADEISAMASQMAMQDAAMAQQQAAAAAGMALNEFNKLPPEAQLAIYVGLTVAQS